MTTKVCYCDYCGKDQHSVRKMIAGPRGYVCDECVDLFVDIINEETTSGIKYKRIEEEDK